MRSTRLIIEAYCVDCLPSVTYACVPSSSFEYGAVVFVFIFFYFSSLRHVRWFIAFTTSTDVLFFFSGLSSVVLFLLPLSPSLLSTSLLLSHSSSLNLIAE